MSFKTTYKQLTDVQVLHNYFLNDGETAFATMNTEQQGKQLEFYNISEFIEIIPSQQTMTVMAGHKLVFKKHRSGFLIYCKVTNNSLNTPFIALPNTLLLTFILKTKDSYFSNYTDFTEGVTDLFYFGNVKPNTEGNSFEYIAKSNQNKLVTDAYKLSSPGATAVLEQLDSQNRRAAFGVVQLHMSGDTANLSLLTNQGKLKNTIPIFKIHFNNRSTFWRYKRSTDDTEIFTTAQVQPLTKNGFVEVTHAGDTFPNPNANQLIPDNNNFFSEIYI